MKRPLTITIDTREFETLLIQSFRYCLGRMTYAVSDCVEMLTLHWNLIQPGVQKQVQDDIKRAIETKSAGMGMDIVEWRKILELKCEQKTMTDDQTKNVASALCELHGLNPDYEVEPGYFYWHDYVKSAQAAIEAMREWAKDNPQTFDWRNGAANSKECIIFPTPPKKG